MRLEELIDKEQIRKVIAYSQDIENPKIDNLIADWAKAKSEIFNRFFYDKLIYTYPEKIAFDLGESIKDERYGSFIEYVINILNSMHHPLFTFLSHVTCDEFYNNCLDGEYIISLRDNKRIPKGAKVIKSFKYFIDDEELLHDLQNKASELIQENKIEGYLTFSIHPLDFLSSSENTYNWRSCHSLDGEYRAGNLSYMCDQSTVMVYLHPGPHDELPHFPKDVLWTNKKWRMLLHFNTTLEACFAGRQYPFFTAGALDKVFQVFSEEIVPYEFSWGGPVRREKWFGWYNDYLNSARRDDGTEVTIDDNRYFIMNQGIYDRYTVVQDVPMSKHFNDVLRSSCYDKPYYMFKRYLGPFEKLLFSVGAPVSCLYCGEAVINGDDTMMCSECECEFGNSESDEYRTCDCCGTRFYYDEGYWVGDEENVCPNCAEHNTFICGRCGERHYNMNKHWSNKLQEYICDYCFEEEEENG